MKYCTNCGNPLADEAEACEKCGNRVGQTVVQTAPPGKGTSGMGVVAFVLSIFGFLTGFLMIGVLLDLVSIVLGILVLRKAKKTPLKTGLPIAGIVISGVSIALCLLLFGGSWFANPSGDLLKEARGYYADGSYALAISTAEELMDEYPNSRAAQKAETLIADCQTAQAGALLEDLRTAVANGDWEEALSLSGELESSPGTDSEMLAECETLTQQAREGQEAAEAEARFQESYEELQSAYDDEDWEEVLESAEQILKLRTDGQEAEAARTMQAEAKTYFESVMVASYAYSDWFRMRENAGILTRYFPEDAGAQEMYDTADGQIMELGRQAVESFRTEYDAVQGITWYYPSNAPEYVNTRCYLVPYIGEDASGHRWMRLKFNYTGDRWVFYDYMIINIDGSNYTLTYESDEYRRDNASGDVWEVTDIPVSGSLTDRQEAVRLMMPLIAASEQTIIRFQGDDRHYDMTVSQADKDGIMDVLYGYEYLERQG